MGIKIKESELPTTAVRLRARAQHFFVFLCRCALLLFFLEGSAALHCIMPNRLSIMVDRGTNVVPVDWADSVRIYMDFLKSTPTRASKKCIFLSSASCN